MKIIAFVPIKLYSERLENKNILPLLGKPLCWHIVDTLLHISQIDQVYVYCSDEKIKNYIPEQAVFLKRSLELDGDKVKGFDIYEKFINQVDSDIYLLAHTTSPFIKKSTVEYALEKVKSGQYDSAFSAKRIQTFVWYKEKPINYNIEDVPRTQDMEPIYIETSGFYIFKKEVFTKHHRRIGYCPFIQEVDEKESIDIDEKSDYELALKYTN